MRATIVLCTILFFSGCLPIGPEEERSGHTFTLKFINTGVYAITGLYLKPASDTTNWGASLLPVSTLDSLDYLLFHNLSKGPVYAFKCSFDSAGTTAWRTFASMYTSGAPDTISAFSSLGPSGDGHGYNWGLQHWEGERVAAQP